MRNGWEYKKIGDICVPKKQIQRATKQFKEDDEIQYIDISSIDNSSQRMTDVTKYIMSNAPSRAQQCVQQGDIVVSTVRPNLKNIAIVVNDDDNLVASSGFCVLRPTKVERNYLFHYITSNNFTNHLMKLTTGANYPAVRDSDVLNSIIPFPPKSTQLAIVSELDKINELIRLKKEQLVEYDNLAQSIFYEMFGDPVENEKGWEVKKLGDICVFSQGIQIDVSKQKNDFQEGYNRFLRIVDYTTFNTDIRYVPVTDKKYWINLEDIVVVRYGASAGFVGIMKEGILANNLFKISYPRDRLEMLYLFHYLQSGYYKSFIQKIAFGAAMPALSFSSFGKLEVMIPPLPLQQSFASRIEQIEKLKSEVQKAITDLETLLASRMQYWFE